MMLDNVLAAMAIGVFAFVSVIVVKLAAIFLDPTLRHWASVIMRQHNRPY